VTFRRPAELVDISERIYQRIFAVGLWVVVGMNAFATVASLLYSSDASPARGLVICGLLTAASVIAAMWPSPFYTALRGAPRLLLACGLALGTGATIVGAQNFQLFLVIITVLGVLGIATSLRMVTGASAIAGLGLALPHVASGDWNLSGTIVVLVPPLFFWLIVERVAGFALRLHQTLEHGEAARRTGRSRPRDPGRPETTSAPGEDPRQLHAPSSVHIAGARLTSRQVQVVMLRCEGLGHGEIGACLSIGTAQVGRHLRNARERINVTNDAQLVAWAALVGLVPARTAP
jgi:DNA-binding CsgD family transcriptional regulator